MPPAFGAAGWVALATGAVLVWLVVVPLVLLLISAFKPTGLIQDPGFTLRHILETYGSAWYWHLVLRTAEFAAGAAALALGLGGLLAWLVERTDMTGRALVRGLILLPMATPPFLLAISWTMLLSPRTGVINTVLMHLGLPGPVFDIYSMAGMIFVEGLSLVPSAFLVLSPAMRNIDPSLEESAQMSGAGTFRTLRRIVFPLLQPAVIGTAIYLFVVSTIVFDIPGTIGMPGRIFVLSSEVYTRIAESPTGLPQYGQVSAMSMLFVVVLIGLAISYQRIVRNGRRFVTVSGKNFRPRLFKLGGWRPVAAALVWLYFIAAVLAPIFILLWMSIMPYHVVPSWSALTLATLENHREFFRNPFIVNGTLHSIVIAVFAASVVACLSLLTAWVANKTKVPGRRVLDLIAFLPIAIPGVLIAVGLIYVYLFFNALGLYGTIWIIAIAYATVYLSFGSRSLNGVVVQLHPELEEAAQLSGASWARTMRRIVIPLTLPALGSVWLWVFSHSLRELGAALTLQGVNNATITTVLYGYWSGGEPNKAAAVGIWLLVGILLVIGVWQALQARRAGES